LAGGAGGEEIEIVAVPWIVAAACSAIAPNVADADPEEMFSSALIVAEPTPTATTFPAASTRAFARSELRHVNVTFGTRFP